MTEWTFLSQGESDTERLGAALAEFLPTGSVVGLSGTLGAGKTRLVRAVAESAGVPRETVASPTFVLVREYHANRPIYHFDTYRIKDEDEFQELGPEEYFYGSGLSFVEWSDRMASVLPPDRLEIAIQVLDEGSRKFMLSTQGDFPAEVLNQVATALTDRKRPGPQLSSFLLPFLLAIPFFF